MVRIYLTIDSPPYQNALTSHVSLNHSTHSTVTPGQVKIFMKIMRIIAINCALIPISSKDDRITAAYTASDNMVVGAAQVFSDFTLLLSQFNHSDLSLNTQDNVLNQVIRKRRFFKNRQCEWILSMRIPLGARTSELEDSCGSGDPYLWCWNGCFNKPYVIADLSDQSRTSRNEMVGCW